MKVAIAGAGGALAARAALQETPKPGPEHAILKHMAGTWDAATPDKGTKTAELGMNGLWLTSDFEGSMMLVNFRLTPLSAAKARILSRSPSSTGTAASAETMRSAARRTRRSSPSVKTMRFGWLLSFSIR